MGASRQFEMISQRTAEAIRYGAILYAMIFSIGGILVAADILSPPPNYIGADSSLILSAVWLIVAWWQFKRPGRKLSAVFARILVFSALTIAFLVWVTGVNSEFAYLWILLMVATGMYFGTVGFSLSAGLLALTIVCFAIFQEISADTIYHLAVKFGLVVTIGTLTAHTIYQSLRDQTELDSAHHEVSKQRDRMTTLMNNLADAVINTDQNGTIVLYNAAVLNLLDTNINLDGKFIDEILPLRDLKDKRVFLSDQLTDSTTVTVRDDLMVDISGEEMRLELTYSPIRNSFKDTASEGREIGGYIIILRDVTKSKSLEEERDEFISVVSHELRTPITIAEGTVSNAQLMLERKDVPVDKVDHAVKIAHNQIVFLSRMVNDLSTLSRAERGVADDVEIIDIHQLATELYHEYRPEAKLKNLAFDLKVPTSIGSVEASRLYLKELLQNFITNAIKYTNTGTITLEAKKSRGKVTVSVTDTGIGMSKTDQKHIFEKFYRSEEYRTRETSGTGLGLYVANKLAKKLDTTIDMTSRLNHGSTFSITLPLVSKKSSTKKSDKLDDTKET